MVVLTSLSGAAAIKIHFISGAWEYKSKESLEKFIPWLQKHYDVRCSVSWGRDGPVEVVNFGKHLIREGVGEITSDKLYKAGPLAKAATVLRQVDIGADKHAVSWINNWSGVRTFALRWACPRILKTKTLEACLPTPFFGKFI